MTTNFFFFFSSHWESKREGELNYTYIIFIFVKLVPLIHFFLLLSVHLINTNSFEMCFFSLRLLFLFGCFWVKDIKIDKVEEKKTGRFMNAEIHRYFTSYTNVLFQCSSSLYSTHRINRVCEWRESNEKSKLKLNTQQWMVHGIPCNRDKDSVTHAYAHTHKRDGMNEHWKIIYTE